MGALALGGAQPSPAAGGPQTEIVAGPGKLTYERRPSFRISTSDARDQVQCRLDGSPWRSCERRHRTGRLSVGPHNFSARAVDSTGAVDPTPATRRVRVLRSRVRIGSSVQGRAIRAQRIGNPNRRRTALVIGSIHGNEAEGHEIIQRIRRSGRSFDRVDLWLVKSVNPDGTAAGTRTNARGVDLNRNFGYRWGNGQPPGAADYAGSGPFSEPESRTVRRLAKRIEPMVTIWYHQPWGQVLLPCSGRARVQKRYAEIARWPKQRCRGASLRGTATSWQNHKLGGTAFVVELSGGEIGARSVRRHARAAAHVAAMGSR